MAFLLKKEILLFFFFFRIDAIQSQPVERYNSFSYNVNEGLLQSTITDIAIDKNNFCWISFPNGIQKFDGNTFTSVPVQAGLPNDRFVNFFVDSNGDLLLSHVQGISKYLINSNKFIEVFRHATSLKYPAIFIGQDKDIIYFFIHTGQIAGINRLNYKKNSDRKSELHLNSSGVEYPIKFSDNIINGKVGIVFNEKIHLWNLRKAKLDAVSSAIPDVSYFFLHLKTESEILYNTQLNNNALLLYNFDSKLSSRISINGKDDRVIYRSVILPWRNRVLLSINNQLFHTDSSLREIKSEMVDFQNQPIAGSAGIHRIKEDHFGNLYLQTINAGIRKILSSNYEIRYYGTLQKEMNNILSLLPDKKANRILVGGMGLMIFDTLQRLIKHIKTLPGKSQPFYPNTIIKKDNGSYLLFNPGDTKVWILNNDLSNLSSMPISSTLPPNKRGIQYFTTSLSQNQNEAIIQSQGKIYKADFLSTRITEHLFSSAYIMGGLLYKNLIITHGNDELIFLDATTFKELKKIPFKNTGYVRCITLDQKNNIYLGSNNGIFKIDGNGKILKHLTIKDGLPDNCIYAMVFDANNDLWCSTNKGIFRLNKQNNVLQLTKEDGLQENEFNTNVVSKSDDGEIFFGGVNGISSFYPENISNSEDKVKILFTKIKINNEEQFTDTAVWNINKIHLPHHQNSLSFDFIAMANANPGQYIYQYRMKGIDEQWLQNKELQTVRYFLPPGKYVFQVAALRYFNIEAEPMKEIAITIHPPFWKTWWFFSVIVLISLSILTVVINQFNRRKYQRKLAVLEGENRIRLERERISRDLHDSIGAYANTVLYKSELLQDEKNANQRTELIKDLQFNSKDIITSLRETIWALKKDNFSAEDCLVRITNFVMPFNRYYQHIKFSIEGEAPAEKSFQYNKALHLVRIVQEAISNAIKHASATNISIQSTVEKNDWKLVISDNGKGFDYTNAKNQQLGNGLINMELRAKDASIIILIDSVKNSGTSITLLC